jgi:hypothetical protein
MAMAACLAFGLIALGAWFQILKNNMETDRQARETKHTPPVLPAQPEQIKQTPGANPPAEERAQERETKKFARQKPAPVKTVFKFRKPAVRNTLLAQGRNIKTEKPKVRLTEEERYAYNQLMLALSITGSKLKIVRDKVQGLEEKPSF